MAYLGASQFALKNAYTKSKYEQQLFGKAHIIACPRHRPSKSFKPFQIKSCSLNPNVNNSNQSASNENSENMVQKRMKIIFVSADIAAWSKTSGIGNVLDDLPFAMAANGHDVMVVTPLYDHSTDACDTGYTVEIEIGDSYELARFFHYYGRGVNRVFVDNPIFIQKVWGMAGGNQDSQICYRLLCLAALEAPRILKFRNEYFSGPYGEDVVFVCNDWHTGILPCYLKSLYQPHGVYANARVAFCIHDIASQGRFAIDDFDLLNLPDSFKPSFEFTDGYGKLAKGKQINWMKAGIQECDLLLTVSPYYAAELCSVEECGYGLGAFIKSKQPAIKGIVHGVDVDRWSPVFDDIIFTKYDASTVNEVKPINKEALQTAMRLPVDRDIPLIVYIGRLEEKNGPDILAAATPYMMDKNVQLIFLGSGKKDIELQLLEVEAKYPEKVRILTSFTTSWVHHVIAGADLLVIPSRSEPCGFTQLIGMQYGTIPVVTCTGGLVDTVVQGKTGFYISRLNLKHAEVDPSDVLRMAETLRRVIKVIGTDKQNEMIQSCMAQDLSWKGPAKEWERALLSLRVKGSGTRVDEEETALVEENEANFFRK